MTQDILSFMPDYLNYIVRILFAALCGFVIGFERKTRSKEAGIRTHTIVALGACLMMVISKYAFWDESGKIRRRQDRRADSFGHRLSRRGYDSVFQGHLATDLLRRPVSGLLPEWVCQ